MPSPTLCRVGPLGLGPLARLVAAVALLPLAAPAQPRIEAERRYAPVARILEPLIEWELKTQGIPAISIALVDDQRIVWARGFGLERLADSVPATAETVHRVGSVSKLFTDLAVMQLVERGALDLDAPVTRYLPEFTPESPTGTPITLRHLMSHRAGLVREPPAGHYFDSSGTSLAGTVASLAPTRLVFAPGERVKYSNAGIAVVGRVLEATQRRPFAAYLDSALLAPLGMRRSAFERSAELAPRVADALMWGYDGRRSAAPTFELGMAPAGSMYTTVLDLGRFLRMLNGGGMLDGRRIVRRETLDAMWTPQFAPGATQGAGIGFFVSDLDGHRAVGHGGAIYGFATELMALPDDKLGVVVVATLDGANAVTDRIARAGLEAMLAVRAGRTPSPVAMTTAIAPDRARALHGRYTLGERGFDLLARDTTLVYVGRRGNVRLALRARGDTLMADGALAKGPYLVPLTGGRLASGADTFTRQPDELPAPAPERWRALIGDYGWTYNPLHILEKDGRLHALIEWFFLYPLTEESDGVFRFPDYGLYPGERLAFQRDAAGRATAVVAAGIEFPRLPTGDAVRITPRRPVADLLRDARAATPPTEEGTFRAPDLVDLASLDSTLRFDIRYATTNNFLGTVFYAQPRAMLQRPAAEAVVRAHRALRERGYGLLIHDGYRPWAVTKVFYDATPDEYRWLVADPSRGSRHNRGAAIDLTLFDLRTGEAVGMPGNYDEPSFRSMPDYPGGTARQRWLRTLLRQAMEAEGFRVYDEEWWHFDYADWRLYPIANIPFEEIPARRDR
jgi:CubicO group peptidase (beta-lactamase class C family)/D-alanyl-D-alanine dipeptidase